MFSSLCDRRTGGPPDGRRCGSEGRMRVVPHWFSSCHLLLVARLLSALCSLLLCYACQSRVLNAPIPIAATRNPNFIRGIPFLKIFSVESFAFGLFAACSGCNVATLQPHRQPARANTATANIQLAPNKNSLPITAEFSPTG